MIRIGYQGIEGSNSEEAAKNIAKQLQMSEYELIPLVTSKMVIGKLKRKEIDYGVVATKNSIGGTVQETYEAIKDEYLELVATNILQIHQCLFVKAGIQAEEITCIASHPQALRQTKNNRLRFYPNAHEEEVEDTAIAAKYLSEGKLPETTAVLCRKNAGDMYNLELAYENMEDGNDNYTEFRMFKMSEIDYGNNMKPSMKEKITFQLVNEKGVGYISKAAIILSIFISFYISEYFNMTAWDTAVFVGGYLSILILLITSRDWGKKARYNAFVGYWKYYSLSEKRNEVDSSQQLDVPRLVKIEEVDGEIYFSGFICDKENVPFFETQKVVISSIGKSKGQLTYWYTNPNELNRGIVLNGIVDLGWIAKYPEAKINLMSGRYFGMSSGDYGQIRYQRISKEEYEVHKNSDFI